MAVFAGARMYANATSFRRNLAGPCGGAIAALNKVQKGGRSYVACTECDFEGNHAFHSGGAVRIEDASIMDARSTRFSGNIAYFEGAAVLALVGSAMQASDCVFAGNLFAEISSQVVNEYVSIKLGSGLFNGGALVTCSGCSFNSTQDGTSTCYVDSGTLELIGQINFTSPASTTAIKSKGLVSTVQMTNVQLLLADAVKVSCAGPCKNHWLVCCVQTSRRLPDRAWQRG